MEIKWLFVLSAAAVGFLSAPAPGGGDIGITVTPMGGSIGEFFSNDVLAGYEYNPPEGLGPEGDITVILTPMGGSIGEFFSNDVIAGYEYNAPEGAGPLGGAVPTPGTIFVIGLGSLLARRRRRAT